MTILAIALVVVALLLVIGAFKAYFSDYTSNEQFAGFQRESIIYLLFAIFLVLLGIFIKLIFSN